MAETDDQETSSLTSEVLTTNISYFSKDECKITINEMSNELYNLHVSLKSLTKENSRLKATIESLSKRNSWLENEAVTLERLKVENLDSKNELVRNLQKMDSLKEELKKEQDVIKSWNNSSRITRAVIENRIKETVLDPKNSKEKKQVEGKQSSDNYLSTDNSDNDYLSVKKNLNDNIYLLNKKNPTNKTIQEMKEKYGGAENFVKEGTPPKEKVVKDESKDNVSKTKEKNKNKNRNGKVGINKHNNYAPDMYAPRKVCAKCGRANHLSIHCKINSTPTSSPIITPSQPLMPNLSPPNLSTLIA